jgi:16S rRNA (guanine527-N7)-methyltransferase
MDLLESGVCRLGLYDPEKLEKLRKYTAELEFWNTRHNLVRAEGRSLAVRHILDSLAGVPVLRDVPELQREKVRREHGRGLKIADIGSGAGLPGVPLAIWLEEDDVFLVEKSEKRCGFLRNVTALCGLKNCSVVCSPIEQIKERFDCCVFRALGDFSAYLPKLAAIIVPGGVLAAYKGKLRTIESELRALGPEWGPAEVRPVAVPFLEEERHIVVLEIANTKKFDLP